MLIFLHIPKTAGSTLSHVLSRQYPRDAQYWLRPNQDRHEHEETVRSLDHEQRKRIELVTGHVPYGIHELFGLDKTQYMTILRHPVARLRSLYLFARSQPRNRLHELACNASLAEFASSVSTAQFDNDQTRFVAGSLAVSTEAFDRPVTEEDLEKAQAHLSEFGAVAVTERFDECLVAMQKAFGWRLPVYSSLKTSDAEVQVTKEARDVILARNRFDVALYGFATELCDSLVRSAGLKPRHVRSFRFANRVAQPVAAVYRGAGRAFGT